jgi:hypothetical protein
VFYIRSSILLYELLEARKDIYKLILPRSNRFAIDG